MSGQAAEQDQIADVIGSHKRTGSGCTCGWPFPHGGGGKLFRLHDEHVAERVLGALVVPPAQEHNHD